MNLIYIHHYVKVIIMVYIIVELGIVKINQCHSTNIDDAKRNCGGGIGYQVSDITSTKCSFGYFSLDTPTPFAVLTVFLDNT